MIAALRVRLLAIYDTVPDVIEYARVAYDTRLALRQLRDRGRWSEWHA